MHALLNGGSSMRIAGLCKGFLFPDKPAVQQQQVLPAPAARGRHLQDLQRVAEMGQRSASWASIALVQTSQRHFMFKVIKMIACAWMNNQWINQAV